MQGILNAALMLMFAIAVNAQSMDWWVSPDTLQVQELPLDSTVAIAEISYGNLAAEDSVIWVWKRVEWTAPQGWVADLCDPSVCHTGVPASSIQLPLAPDAPSFLKFLISSRGIPGTAEGEFWVYPQGQIEDRISLHFTFFSGSTHAQELKTKLSFRPYPNPTEGAISWDGPWPLEGTWTLYSISGAVYKSGLFPVRPDLVGAPAGAYLFVTSHTTRSSTWILKH